MATLPSGWIAMNPAPETETSYTGDPIALSTPDTPQLDLGAQVQTANSDGAGTYAGIPVMSITPAVGASLEGPQPSQ
jgi:hypothetical protein